MHQRARIPEAPATREGVASETLDNGLLSCEDPERVQQVCDDLSAEKIARLDSKWMAHLPARGSAQAELVGGQRAPDLRFGDPRVLALFLSLLMFRLLPQGFANRDLRHSVAGFLGVAPGNCKPGRMSYDMRRLRLHGQHAPSLLRMRPK